MEKMSSCITRRADENGISPLQLFWTTFGADPSHVFESGWISHLLHDWPEDDDGKEMFDYTVELQELDTIVKQVTDAVMLGEMNSAGAVVRRKLTPSKRVYSAYITFSHPSKGKGMVVEIVVCTKPGSRGKEINVMSQSDSTQYQNLCALAWKLAATREVRDNTINIITTSSGDFYLSSIDMERNANREFSYEYYNDGFQQISERVIAALKTDNESGLVLLHGDTGTGKTSYLKHLLHIISNKKIIYVPPDLTESLSAPSFMNFLISNAKNSILLIEDAENVLKHREAGGNQAVSNILNISNGILGDILRMQIVCTFNCSIKEIDPALLRPGRLVAEYQFDKLSLDRSRDLVKTLHGEDVAMTVEERLTLAEAFNITNMPDKTKIVTQKLGFV